MEWLALTFIIATVGIASFILGVNAGTERGALAARHNIMTYIEKTMPSRWAAYKKGVTEGYEQGIADEKAGAFTHMEAGS